MESTTKNIHAEIIERCRQGDETAQYELYKRYSKAMFNTALRICRSREEAEDVLQEAFLSAFRNIHAYREEATFGAWLKRIVVNRALTALKRSDKEALMIDETTEVPDIINDDQPVELDVSRIKAAILDLPKGFRSVLSLYLFEGYDHQEISQIMGISESTSKTQYKRAKDKLKTLLTKEMKYG